MNIREYYSRKDVQQELLRLSQGRELQAWFGDVRGTRPEVVNFEGDLKDLIRQGMTSFHVSEEQWKDPLLLKSGLTKRELNDLRAGWDCILDLDSKNLEFSKMCAELIIDALKDNDINCYSIKFSGNHGFHIAIPFEAFPKEVNNVNIKDYFPDGVRIISEYLKDMIRKFLRSEILDKCGAEDAAKSVGKTLKDVTEKICLKCKIKSNDIIESNCKDCSTLFGGKSDYCPQCNSKNISTKNLVVCSLCKNSEPGNFRDGEFDPFKVVDIDSILISSRHLFRCVYSINEKSGLVSIPIRSVKDFNVNDAKMENVNIDPGLKFLDRSRAVKDEAGRLLIQAFDSRKSNIVAEEIKKPERVFEVPKVAIKADYFPQCILKLMSGVKEDGRKRAIFVLVNFLQNVGWNLDDIEKFLLEWNKKNYEPLREGYVRAQVSWFKRQKRLVPPPNCGNESYYKTMGVKCEDNICSMCKNPVNYVFRRLKTERKRKA